MQGTKQQWSIAAVLATILAGSPLTSSANDDGEIRLRSRKIQPDAAGSLSGGASIARRQLILKFEVGRMEGGLEELKGRGVTILEYVPEKPSPRVSARVSNSTGNPG